MVVGFFLQLLGKHFYAVLNRRPFLFQAIKNQKKPTYSNSLEKMQKNKKTQGYEVSQLVISCC